MVAEDVHFDIQHRLCNVMDNLDANICIWAPDPYEGFFSLLAVLLQFMYKQMTDEHKWL